MKLSQIDFSRTKAPLLAKIIRDQIASGVVRFSDIRSTAPNAEEISNYNSVIDTFFVDQPMDKVFSHYLTSNPYTAWKGGRMVELALAVDKRSGTIYYDNESYPGASLGQVMYIHMNFFFLHKICVGQEIIDIDWKNHRIIFSYIEGSKTAGMQVMQFSSNNVAQTKIVHTSFFKGKSAFRDRFLYPFFHTMVVTKFHRNLKNSLS